MRQCIPERPSAAKSGCQSGLHNALHGEAAAVVSVVVHYCSVCTLYCRQQVFLCCAGLGLSTSGVHACVPEKALSTPSCSFYDGIATLSESFCTAAESIIGACMRLAWHDHHAGWMCLVCQPGCVLSCFASTDLIPSSDNAGSSLKKKS